MENMIRIITSIAVSVFAVVIGLKMWFVDQGIASPLALAIILIGTSALESNIALIIKKMRNNGANQAGG